MIMFEMAWSMTKDNLDMIWWAIIGSAEQAILGKVESRLSVLEEGFLQAHVSRLTHKKGAEVDKQQQQQSAVKITYDKEYPFESNFYIINIFYICIIYKNLYVKTGILFSYIDIVSCLYYIVIGL